MKRFVRPALLSAVSCLAIALWATALPHDTRVFFQGGSAPSSAGETKAAPAEASRVLVQIFRGRSLPSGQEVSITTIFRSQSFAVLADADVTGGSEEDLVSQVRQIFSLGEVSSIGSTIVPLSGGAALLEDDGERIELRLEGHPVGEHAARIVVSESHGGREVVATSVIARSGRTVVLAGPAEHPGRADRQINFVCLTPLD